MIRHPGRGPFVPRPPRSLCILALLLSVTALVSCRSEGVRFQDGVPDELSAWGLIEVSGGNLRLSEGVLPYELTSALFTDYAHKLRTVWMPEGTTATANEDGSLNYPVGTILSKTFYYPLAYPVGGRESWSKLARTSQADLRVGDLTEPLNMPLDGIRLVETRLMVHRESGWVTLPYVWDDQQRSASLSLIGADFKATLVDTSSGGHPPEDFLYVVPDANQCGGCHITSFTTKQPLPIGPKLHYLNRKIHYAGADTNQLTVWTEAGYLDPSVTADEAPLPRAPDALDPAAGSLNERARAYLDINCAHCHNPEGAGDTSGLFLDLGTTETRRLGSCKPPIAAGRGTGGYRVAISPGKPDESILPFRMASSDPSIAMPELGRSTVHQEGVELIKEWIRALEGECEPALSTGP